MPECSNRAGAVALPRLGRLYIVSIAWGALLGAVFTGLLIALDVAGLRHLVWATRGGFIAVAMLLAFHILLFSGVQFGIAVMRMAQGRDSGPRGLRRPLGAPLPIMIPARKNT